MLPSWLLFLLSLCWWVCASSWLCASVWVCARTYMNHVGYMCHGSRLFLSREMEVYGWFSLHLVCVCERPVSRVALSYAPKAALQVYSTLRIASVSPLLPGVWLPGSLAGC